MTLQELLDFRLISTEHFNLNVSHILAVLLIITIARLFVWVIKGILSRYFRKRAVDSGRRYAITQFLKYIVYTGALILSLEAVGISVTLLLGGAAALLVGIGLGLQQTFNDLFSGIILLMEGSMAVDDVVEVDGIVGHVTAIGIRTTQVETRDNVSLVIPNSKLVGDKTTNWSHNEKPTRFNIMVGVAYASDVELVTNLLLQAAKEHQSVLDSPAPRVQFRDFGNSSLDFALLFFSNDFLSIEFIKSDLRYRVNQLFRQNKIEIPFPQRDIWFKNSVDLNNNQ